MNKRAIICFTRVPRPGFAKTRLIPLLGAENSALLQWAMLRDVAKVQAVIDADLFVAYAPDDAWQELCDVFSAAEFFSQAGEDLGARMDNAMRHIFHLGYDACLLTGSDLPLLTAEHLASGFSALDGADVVLGATADGGYYLVGAKKAVPEIFSNQSYGGADVYSNTIAAAEKCGYTVGEALPCADIDTAEDLHEYWQEIMACAGETADFLREVFKDGEAIDQN